jgi:single-stranded-DNA-specific exonuclease RecJ
MFHDKKWVCANPDTDKIKGLADRLSISPILAMVLVSRGIDDVKEAERFLYPQLSHLADPLLMPDMGVSVDRIIRALDSGERICIYGDYDVDGITSVSFLMKVLSAAGADVTYYIPGRLEEGYGLNEMSVREIHDTGVSLIITVDCGTSSHEEIELCGSLGMDVIVTDHHQCPQKLPPALGVINPKRSDSRYPFSEFAGVGVAYNLCRALEARLWGGGNYSLPPGKSLSDSMLDLVALGTVADIVPLTGENRVLASLGLKRMAVTENIGLRALIKVAGLQDGPISSGQVAFVLAPRLNAAGRLADAKNAVRLLLSRDEKTALQLAKELDERNRERQRVENRILDGALKMAEKRKGDSILVLASEGWHPGVIGIAASKMVERYNKPAVLFSIDGDEARGSARSVPGLDLYELLSRCRHYYKSFGGHKQAAGLTMETGCLEDFAREVNAAAADALKGLEAKPVIWADGDLTGVRVTAEDAKSLKLLEPFGCGNATPLFIKRRVGIAGIKRVGSSREHIKVIASDGFDRLDCIAFRWMDACWPVAGQRTDLAFTPQVNQWLGRENLQLAVKDIRDFSKEECFLKSWYESMLDLDRHGVLAPAADFELSGIEKMESGCGYQVIRELFRESTGNLVLVNGYSDVLDVLSMLLLYPNVEVQFGRIESCCADRNYVIVHPYSLEGMEGCSGKLYFFAHSVMPMQLRAIERLKTKKCVMLTDLKAPGLGTELLSLIPERDTFVTLYRTVKKYVSLGFNDVIRWAVTKGISPASAVIALESLIALGLAAKRDGGIVLETAPQNKVNLQDAPPIKIIKAAAAAAENCYETVKAGIYGV